MSRPPSIYSLKPLRWIVTHLHAPLLEDGKTRAPVEEVRVSYNSEHKDALSFAINTASRYEGTIYADTGDRFYTFVRSYGSSLAKKLKQEATTTVEDLENTLFPEAPAGAAPAPVT
jgi:hypothetical protein